ncbi:HEAT repeat domain-containing protein [Thalassoroseus pseudoceratinae]|uniref:HEAT repeat domain-containing protein n=1 Tax=Thalassoroseus pseudoceratinae TaxID=2713176 RepID=UPI00141F3F6C|nr:HEAT repeat domain-containing protein [Thalassoroseus pseudoceratinae]
MNCSRLLLALTLLSSPLGGSLVTAAELSPQVQQAVDRGLKFILGKVSGASPGQDTIGAYAALKAGAKPDHPAIAKVTQKVTAAVQGTRYQPRNTSHNYTTGVDLMFLEAVDAKKYKTEIEAIARHLLSTQLRLGAWHYLSSSGGNGDTSQTQYALLGLWAAKRAGSKIPLHVWDRAATWHIVTQCRDGSFAYHPNPNGNNNGGTLALTVNGISSLIICRMQLYPNAGEIGSGRGGTPAGQENQEDKADSKKFGFLEQVDIDEAESEREKEAEPDGPVRTSLARIDAAIERALSWVNRAYLSPRPPEWPMYYIYGLERMAAFANIETIAGRNWYDDGTNTLLRLQRKDGGWPGQSSDPATTGFGLLFLTRATAKLLGRKVITPQSVGSGLLIGGRGLPDNLGRAEIEDGKVKQQKVVGPLDELLAELEKLDTANVASAQAAVVDQIKIGNKEDLVGQTEKLIKLADDPRPEVRRTAIWAIGQTADMGLARLLIEALDDENLDILVETQAALRTLSRLPRGQNLPNSPWNNLAADATKAERTESLKNWKQRLRDRWRRWYIRTRPYDQRSDLFLEVRSKD